MTSKAKNPIQPGDGDPRHGTNSGWQYHKCKCDLCREKRRLFRREYFGFDEPSPADLFGHQYVKAARSTIHRDTQNLTSLDRISSHVNLVKAIKSV